ncbi:DNA-protecting protein DprA [Candidatus Falkowbacteria bacterium]|nr:DNA-protecting protein DprA [Candidatus Falkowbacteria bacterium]
MASESVTWAAIGSFSKFGPARLSRLESHFKEPDRVLKASASELAHAGLDPALAQEFAAWRHGLDLTKFSDWLEREKIDVILRTDPGYPELLASIYQPPFLLYSKGAAVGKELALAVVGARKFSIYGRQAVEQLVGSIARNITVVSGLALGIDALAHQAALDAGGRTIAVLGSGLDRQSIYPSNNRYLAEKIIGTRGQLLSEFAPGTPPLKHHFPLRNRIISGISQATLVIEAALKSGSLITAYQALEQGREVFAVPGSIYSPLSAGTNQLIKQGATSITSSEDILSALDLTDLSQYIGKHAKTDASLSLDPTEAAIMSALSQEAKHIELIIAETGLTASQANGALTLLEIKGLARNIGGMQYIRKI